MTIVDQQHAAELVSTKGKVFKFDAIECMLNFEKESTDTEFALHLVNVYDQPKLLNDAGKSVFLISKALPSPMGAYLTAFKDQTAAKEFHASKGGQLFDWESLQQHFDSLVLDDY